MTFQQVDRVREAREKVATMIRDLARRKLDRAPLRQQAVERLFATGMTKTDADKRHMEDGELRLYDAETAELEYDIALATAEAESARLLADYELANLRTVGV